MYAIEFLPRARRQFLHLPRDIQVRIDRELERLQQDPFHPGTTALQGGLRPYRRSRVGDYRVVYEVERGRLVVTVVEVDRRAIVYQRL